MSKSNEKIRTRGLRSISATLIIVTFALIAATSLFLSGMGITFLKKSMDASTLQYKQAMDEGYKAEIKSQVQTAIAITEGYHRQFQEGTLSEADAKHQALEVIRNMRYRDDDSGYMWVDGTDYTLIMHPILSDKEGINRHDLTDQNGVKIIQVIMKAAQAGGGYNEFYFTKSDGVTVAPKVAYSEQFEPWGWVITTGNYVDDMNAQVAAAEQAIQEDSKQMTMFFFMATVVTLVAALVISFLFGHKIAKGIRSVEGTLRKAADGNLTFEISPKLLKRADEVGTIARSLDAVKQSLADIIGNVSSTGTDLKNSSEKFNEKFLSITTSIKNANAAIEDLAQGAVRQASETETVNMKINELGKIINVEKTDVQKLGESVASMMQYSSGAQDSIHALNEITDQTTNAIRVLHEQTDKNNESAANINKAVVIIKNLAAQTNLLSLNASIEAARAGAAGKAFAVVAEEIRKLAEESAESAAEIETVIKEVTENAENSSEKMQEVTSNVQKQTDTLGETAEAFDHLYTEIQIVETAAKEIGSQTDVLDSLKQIVADSINNLESVVEANAASTEQTSASMQQLADTIEECSTDTRKLLNLSQRQNEETSKFQL